MLLHRKNDSRDAELDVAQAMRIAVNAQQEIGIDDHALQRELDPAVEGAAVAPPLIEELQQRLRVGGGQRAAVGEPRDPARAIFVAHAFRLRSPRGPATPLGGAVG